MQGQDRRAHLLEYAPDEGFGHDTSFNLLEQRASISVFQNHVGNIALFLEVIIDEADNVWVF